MGREFQLDHGAEREREVEYSGRDMFCVGDYEHEYCAGAEYPGKAFETEKYQTQSMNGERGMANHLDRKSVV